jgi:hypothetical protein
MVPLNLKELSIVYPIEEYLFKDKLYEITIYTSMCYFTMATEIRFIDSNMKISGEKGNGNNPSVDVSSSLSPRSFAKLK